MTGRRLYDHFTDAVAAKRSAQERAIWNDLALRLSLRPKRTKL